MLYALTALVRHTRKRQLVVTAIRRAGKHVVTVREAKSEESYTFIFPADHHKRGERRRGDRFSTGLVRKALKQFDAYLDAQAEAAHPRKAQP